MERQRVIEGLREAQELLSENVPVIMAWDARKAVKAAAAMLEGGDKNAEAV